MTAFPDRKMWGTRRVWAGDAVEGGFCAVGGERAG